MRTWRIAFLSHAIAMASAIAMANPVEVAYSAIWKGFYGPGAGKTLMKVSPALLPDGTPDYIIDEKMDTVSLQMRLEVDTPAFEMWRQDAHARLAALGTAQCRPVALNDAGARIIGGRAFRFGADGEKFIRDWENNPAATNAAIAFCVEAFSSGGRPLGRWSAPLRVFTRGEENAEFPLPLHRMNRLLDIPPSIWKWVAEGVEPNVDAEVAKFIMPLPGLTSRRVKAIASLKCTMIDEGDFMPDLLATTHPEILKLDTDMIAVPGRDFLVLRYEVTQALWESVLTGTTLSNPSSFKGPYLPVETVSWNDCTEFLTKLNAIPIIRLRGYEYRLPTEEEWEYACRAGSEGAYCRNTNGVEVAVETLDTMAWFRDNSEKQTHAVCEKEPNAFGLYDMHGNVWEWTSSVEESDRITKGGAWNGDAGRCESANRNRFYPAHRFPFVGLRLVRDVIPQR